ILINNQKINILNKQKRKSQKNSIQILILNQLRKITKKRHNQNNSKNQKKKRTKQFQYKTINQYKYTLTPSKRHK
uniref:hypothetical protein n=1 Tax=Salmonella enterica TaxID=28901 RepID=UPI0020C5A9DE